MSRLFIFLGIALIIIGVLWPLLHKFGLGHLPGDIYIKGKNFSFYFPLMTSIIISIIITIILWFFRK